MHNLLTLSRLLLQEKKHILLAALFGLLAAGSFVGLMAAAALLISKAALQPPLYTLTLTIIAVRFFGLTRAGTRYLERYFSHKATFAILGRLRVFFYEKLEPLVPGVFLKYRSGDLLSRVVADVENLQYFFLRIVYPPLIMVLVFIFTGIFLGFYALDFALILLVGFIIAAIIIPILVTVLRTPLGNALRQDGANLSSLTAEFLYGFYDLKINNRLSQKTGEIKKVSDGLVQNQFKAAASLGINESLLLTVSYLTAWSMLVMGIILVQQEVILGVHLAMIVLAAMTVFEAALPMAAIPGYLDENKAAAGRLFSITDQDCKKVIPDYSKQIEPASMSLEIKDLTFAYPNQDVPALKNIDISLDPGKKIAVVGPSGSGKSSLLNIILRFYDYEKGIITFGSEDIKKYDPEKLRKYFGVVAQSNHFFNLTLRENLLFAKPHAGDEELLNALKRVSLAHVPLEFNIGEKGSALSGGERQRLAIARMLLKDAPVVFLDEPTTGLDAVTEAEILALLRSLIEGKSLLYITHKLDGLHRMDEIIALHKGTITERGTYGELMEKKGYFYSLSDTHAASRHH